MTWPVPTGRLVALAALAALAIVLVGDLGSVAAGPLSFGAAFLIANAVVAAIAVGDALAAVRPRSIDVERAFPPVVTIGDDVELVWRVGSTAGRQALVSVADEVPSSFDTGRRRFTATVPPSGLVTSRIGAAPRRRGRFTLPELVVRTRSPLGLIHWQQRRAVRDQMRVLPPFRSQRDAELALHQARTFDTGLRSVRGAGTGTDFDSLRELTPDDQTRHIDWAATARRGRPIVRTYRAEQNQTVVVAVDTGRLMAGRVGGAPRLEWAMDGAMLLAEVATGLGDRMGLVAFDRGVHTVVDPSNRRGQRRTVTDAMFDLEPSLDESELAVLAEWMLTRHRRRAMLVIVTELAAEVVQEFVLPVLPSLTRSHHVVVVAVRDPDLAAWAAPGGTNHDAEGAFLRAESVRVGRQRDEIAGRMRRLGARVVDVTPDRLSAALVDVYLDAKHFGRL
ncbi:MAG: DUF58 domain-containing protein [Acidimicrobiales bacterium]